MAFVKLTPQAIHEVRELRRRGVPASDLAPRYSVHVSTIYRILGGIGGPEDVTAPFSDARLVNLIHVLTGVSGLSDADILRAIQTLLVGR